MSVIIYQDLGMEGGKNFMYQRRVAFDLFHAFLKICDRGQCNGGKARCVPLWRHPGTRIYMKINIPFHWDLW